MVRAGRIRVALVSLLAGLLASVAATGCSSNSHRAVSCASGVDCVRVTVAGAVTGTLTTTSPPGNSGPECAVQKGPPSAWSSRQYGAMDGHRWLLAVQVPGYRSPGEYPATVTLSDLSAGAAGNTYVGQGTTLVGSGATVADVFGQLKHVGTSSRRLSIGGTISCKSLAASL